MEERGNSEVGTKTIHKRFVFKKEAAACLLDRIESETLIKIRSKISSGFVIGNKRIKVTFIFGGRQPLQTIYKFKCLHFLTFTYIYVYVHI